MSAQAFRDVLAQEEAAVHLITSRDVSGFEGFPMPPEFPVYPSRDQMRAYIESVADRFGVRRHITFNTKVTRIDPEGPGGEHVRWVKTSDGGRTVSDAVILTDLTGPSHCCSGTDLGRGPGHQPAVEGAAPVPASLGSLAGPASGLRRPADASRAEADLT
jgi:flavin-binding monooxygenase-like protein